MIFPPGATQRTSFEDVNEQVYDAVIVGAGIASSIIANELARAGKSVLILEAGPKGDATFKDYEAYLNRYYATAEKDNQSPYPANANASMPRSTDARPIRPGVPNTSGYVVQNGPLSTDTTYTRVRGGTTMHWEAKVLRMLPEDFRMHTLYDQGQDWPFDFEEILPYYALAEREIGVSGDVDDQEDYLKPSFPKNYIYPMKALPLSYLDQMVGRGIDGTRVELEGESYDLKVRSFPQGRNGIPNPAYIDPVNGSKVFVPDGAVSTNQVEIGGRCQGNNNCVPICPVQAKYNANKTLAKAFHQPGRVELLAQAVASKVHVDNETGLVTHIEVKKYDDPASPEFRTGIARGRIYVLGANAIENPRLMLASGLPSTSGLMGRNFMDHAYLLCWALMPIVCGTMRGTNCTGGITARARWVIPQQAGRLQRRHPQRRLGLGGRLARLRPLRDGRLAVQIRPGAAAGPGRPDHAPVAARLHDRGDAEPQQPGQRGPALHRRDRQHATRDFLRSPRIHDAGRGLCPPVRPPGLPAAWRRRPDRVQPRGLRQRHL